jgi:hypothetical protein
MASLVVAGDSSGAITIAAPAVAGTNTLTLPASTGTLVVTGGAQTIEFADGSAAAPSITNSGDTNTGIFFPAADTIAFTEGGTESMRIDSSGNMGIGTTSPVANRKLTIGNTGQVAAMRINAPTGYDSFIEFTENNSVTANEYWQINKTTSTHALQFWNGSERMRITSGGSLCIGRTTNIFGSGAGLCVETSSNSVNCVVTNSGQSALSAVNTAVNTGTSCSLVSFNVGISGGGSQIGTITYNGTNTLYNSTSDQRLKKNIVDSGSGLAKLANIKIRAFDWVEHDNHTDFGVVAQELVTFAPEAVSVGDTGEAIERVWAVDTAVLVPAMIKAIQEQQQIINDLKARIETLEGAK